MAATRTTCGCCYEYAKANHYDPGPNCQDYNRQCTWTARVRRLLADPTPWHARPVPQVDYRAPTYPLPAVAPEVKAFRKALLALGDWQRDATPTRAGGACAECLYSEYATAAGLRAGWTDAGNTPIRLLPIPHTCGLAVAVPTPTRRRKAA